jgi:uncharacterized protein
MIRSLAVVLLLAGLSFSQAPESGPPRPPAGPEPGLAPKMKVNELGKTGRTFEVLFSKGDEVASGLVEFAEKYHITAAHFTGIGAFDSATLRWTDVAKRGFKTIPVNEEAEVVSFSGNITHENGKTNVHAHCVLSLADGSTRGGHFVDGHVSIVMQVFVVDSDPAKD